MKDWTAEAVAKMHSNRITQITLAQKMGVTNDYISMILLGKREPKGASKRIMSAIDEIIEERESK